MSNRTLPGESGGSVHNRQLVGKEFCFSAGLLGFPACRHYKIERFNADGDEESPFLILNSLDQDLSFPLIQPDAIELTYRFPAGMELLTALGARSKNDLVALLIVTVRDRMEDITLNLQGPLIVNPASSLGMQMVIEEYPLRHPLFKVTSS